VAHTSDLTQHLRLAEVDENEFAQLLGERFHSGSQHDNEVRYSRSGDQDYALKLVYESDRLVGAESGPDWKPDDLEWLRERIAKDLLGPAKRRIARDTVFSSVPIQSVFRVDDLVQLLPAPDSAPRPPFLMADHPLIMEFGFNTTSVVWTYAARRSRGARQLVRLLNVLFHGGIRQIGQGFHWSFMPTSKDTEPLQLDSRYLQEGYAATGVVHEQDDFSKADGLPQMTLVKADTYFGRLGIGGEGSTGLDAADVLPDLVRAFFGLSEKSRRKFLRAAFWYQQAYRTDSPSPAFVATVSAIEALVPPDTTSATCEKCGRSLAKGPTQRFIDFLEQIAPYPGINREQRRSLYWRRSRLAHGDSLFLNDEELNVSLNPQMSEEWWESNYARRLARIVLINWLVREGFAHIRNRELFQRAGS